MERLKQRYDYFELALRTLDDSINEFKQLCPDEKYYSGMRDSVIQRFEYTLDTFWKFIKKLCGS